MCDMIYASQNSIFGQPEIKIGTIPGGGATQRITKTVGKYKAMEYILTGKTFSAEKAKEMGIVCEIFKDNDLIPECLEIAKTITKHPQHALILAKKAINMSLNTGLDSGIEFERSMFYSTFSLVF